MRLGMLTSIALITMVASLPAADSLTGTYVEARTCQVYTGPCFANGEVGSAGKNAIMTWQIENGHFGGVDLAGQSVSVVIRASHTLGFQGLDDAETKKALVIINSSADEVEADALRKFALVRTGLSEKNVKDVQRAEIEMQFDRRRLAAVVRVGEIVQLEARRAQPGDCICSNESAYYPPLTELAGFVPGVTINGDVSARALGTRWSIPDSRTAYLGTFDIDETDYHVAEHL